MAVLQAARSERLMIYVTCKKKKKETECRLGGGGGRGVDGEEGEGNEHLMDLANRPTAPKALIMAAKHNLWDVSMPHPEQE